MGGESYCWMAMFSAGISKTIKAYRSKGSTHHPCALVTDLVKNH